MSSPAAKYVEGIHKKTTLYAAWPPNQLRKLGDVGRLSKGQFERVTTLQKLGVAFTERVGPALEDMSHASGNDVSLRLKASGETLAGSSIPNAKAGALVEFSSSGAFVFQAETPRLTEIEDQAHLSEDIVGLFRTKRKGKRVWDKDWCVITELLSAEKMTVLVASSKSAKVELSTDGSLPAGPAPLAAVQAGLSVSAQKGEVTTVLAKAGLTPMFRLTRLRRSLLDRLLDGDGSAELGRAIASPGGGGLPKRVLEQVPFDDAAKPAKPRPGRPASTRKPAATARKPATARARRKRAPRG